MLKRYFLIFLTTLAIPCLTTMAFPWSESLESLLPRQAPAGWAFNEAPEVFTRETLFEHINGEADLFVKYGFDKSVFAILQKINSPDEKIDIDIYDMVIPLQAFGIFSRFRQSESPAGIGSDSYFRDRYALFYKDRYFVALQSSRPDDTILKEVSKSIERLISGISDAPKEIGYFPKNGLKPGSIEYYPEGLLGNQFMKGGFKASYYGDAGQKAVSGETSTQTDCNLFLAIFDNPEQASEAMRLFRDKLIKNGKLSDHTSRTFGYDSLSGADLYQGNVMVLREGHYLVGTTGFEDTSFGELLISELLKKIQ